MNPALLLSLRIQQHYERRTLNQNKQLSLQLQALGACENMMSVLSQEKNNTESRDAVDNAGKQIVLVAGSLLGGAVLSSGTANGSQVRAP